MLPPLIHIGYHKTASSFLQDRVFLDQKLGFRRLKNDRRNILNAFVAPGPLDGVPEQLECFLREEQRSAARDGLQLVLSHERLSGYPPSGGFDQISIAQRIAQVFPSAKILIVVREQTEVIKSLYLQYITDGGTLSIRKFIKGERAIQKRMPMFRLDFYEYDKLVAYYQSLFGSSEILVLPYEALNVSCVHCVSEVVSFANGRKLVDHGRICSICTPKNGFDPRVNKSRPVAMQILRRMSNQFVRSQLSPDGLVHVPEILLERGFRGLDRITQPLGIFDSMLDRSIRRVVEGAVRGRYVESNRRLSEISGAALYEFGYQM